MKKDLKNLRLCVTVLLCLLLCFSFLLGGCAELDETSDRSMPEAASDDVSKQSEISPSPAIANESTPTEEPIVTVTQTADESLSLAEEPNISPTPDNSPTPTPVPIPEYTTNTLDKALEGAEGWFSYVNDEESVHEYVFIDFDERYVYLYDYDTTNPSESFGACFLLDGGNLNSGINVKGYTDESEITFSYRFKVQRVPDKLIMSDVDGSTMELKATDLISAIDLVENFDLYDFTSPSNIVRSTTPEAKQYTGKLDEYESNATVYYVVNINTYKFHRPTCHHINRMYEENTRYSTENGFASQASGRDWLINHGFSPCGTCKP